MLEFAKGYAPNWSEEVFEITVSILFKNTVPWTVLKILYQGHMLLMIPMVRKLLKRFIKKNCGRLFKKNLE